jgi:hypothetical protein
MHIFLMFSGALSGNRRFRESKRVAGIFSTVLINNKIKILKIVMTPASK